MEHDVEINGEFFDRRVDIENEQVYLIEDKGEIMKEKDNELKHIDLRSLEFHIGTIMLMLEDSNTDEGCPTVNLSDIELAFEQLVDVVYNSQEC